MADNISISTAGGPRTLASDEVAGVQVLRHKLQFGQDGSATDVSSIAPLPTYTGEATSSIKATLATDYMMSGTSQLVPKFAAISASGADTTLVSSVLAKKIRVLALVLTASGGAGGVRFESGTGGTALTGVMELLADTALVLPFNPVGWFETAVTTLLNMELTTITDADGCLVYVEV